MSAQIVQRFEQRPIGADMKINRTSIHRSAEDDNHA